MSSNGILHQTSWPHTPQQNEVAEHKNRHLVEITRTLLLHGNVPLRFGGDAVLTAGYLINRMPSSVINNKIPHSILFPNSPLHPIPPRVFGSTCFVHNLSPGLDKLAARSLKCVFLGYHRSQKGYRCYSHTLQRYLISADVTFFESVPYFGSNPVSPEPLQESTSTPFPTVINVPPTIIPHQSMAPDPLLLDHFKHISVVAQRLSSPSLRSYLSLRSLQTLLRRLRHHRIRSCNLSPIFRLPFEKVYVKHEIRLHIILIYVIIVFPLCSILVCLLCLLFLFLKLQVKHYLTLSGGKQ
jgi:hypothetical protein